MIDNSELEVPDVNTADDGSGKKNQTASAGQGTGEGAWTRKY